MLKPKHDIKTFMLLMERGEIVISDVQIVEKGYIFIAPALVIVERSTHGPLGFVLMSWLPNELMENTCVVISANRVVGIMTPSKPLVDYYRAWAGMEKDKLSLFKKDFANQISAIQKFQVDKYSKTKERKKREVFIDSKSITPLPDAIIQMFEEDNTWGDPTVTQ